MSGLPGLKTVGLLGGGVIGGAWAARFALNGVDVKLYDIDPQATRKMGEIMANARRAYQKLTLAPLPQEGTITFVSTPEEAVTDVDFVQESAPERLELKQELLARASNSCFNSRRSGALSCTKSTSVTASSGVETNVMVPSWGSGASVSLR